MTTGDAPLASQDCEWCREVLWRFRCAKCDPRREKRLCLDCAKRWHSRGASAKHPLVDRTGATRTYSGWLEHILNSPTTTNVAITTAIDVTNKANGGNAHVVNTTEGMGTETTSKPDSVVAETQASHEETGEAPVEYDGSDDNDKEPEVPQEIPAQLSEETQLDLEDVLNRIPTDDRAILDALADHIHDMLRLEDAILCHSHTKCEAPTCQSILSHQRHVLERKVCSIPTCQSIASYMTHMELCKTRNCPFCVRIQQRRLFGKKQALDHVIHNQRRQLQDLRRSNGDQALSNFLEDQIRANERKKRRATDEVEALNRIVVNNKLPIFNFPRFSWHITYDPLIKEEPMYAEETSATGAKDAAQPDAVESAPSPQTNSTSPDEKQAANEHIDGSTRAEEEQEEAESKPHAPSVDNDIDDGPHTDASGQDDYVTSLLVRKENGDEEAKEQFEESVQLALRIVDASFCSHAKASRCLLQCQMILVHLQHHVNLCVCKDKMCEITEQHFSHLSKCKNEGTDGTCEYCVRVTEREYARAVEVMEAEQPETDQKIRVLIAGITESLSNDPHDEREQNVMQLEDELQQAEDYKKALTKKVDTARMNLVKARRRMKRHPAHPAPSYITGLPLHWVKATRITSPSKRRR